MQNDRKKKEVNRKRSRKRAWLLSPSCALALRSTEGSNIMLLVAALFPEWLNVYRRNWDKQ